MPAYRRYAIYYLPPPGPLETFGARWLGWDVRKGCAGTRYPLDGLESMVTAPSRYGLHATLKPPFALAEGHSQLALTQALESLGQTEPPADLDGLRLGRLGRFLALLPSGDSAGTARLSARIVEELNTFRAPLSPDEIARHRTKGLTPSQDAHLLRWGYPYVLDQFRFHITLTGKLSAPERRLALGWLDTHLPELPRPFFIDDVALVGERDDGFFEEVERVALTGNALAKEKAPRKTPGAP